MWYGIQLELESDFGLLLALFFENSARCLLPRGELLQIHCDLLRLLFGLLVFRSERLIEFNRLEECPALPDLILHELEQILKTRCLEALLQPLQNHGRLLRPVDYQF